MNNGENHIETNDDAPKGDLGWLGLLLCVASAAIVIAGAIAFFS